MNFTLANPEKLVGDKCIENKKIGMEELLYTE